MATKVSFQTEKERNFKNKRKIVRETQAPKLQTRRKKKKNSTWKRMFTAVKLCNVPLYNV
jgi:hypothetical protein